MSSSQRRYSTTDANLQRPNASMQMQRSRSSNIEHVHEGDFGDDDLFGSPRLQPQAAYPQQPIQQPQNPVSSYPPEDVRYSDIPAMQENYEPRSLAPPVLYSNTNQRMANQPDPFLPGGFDHNGTINQRQLELNNSSIEASELVDDDTNPQWIQPDELNPSEIFYNQYQRSVHQVPDDEVGSRASTHQSSNEYDHNDQGFLPPDTPEYLSFQPEGEDPLDFNVSDSADRAPLEDILNSSSSEFQQVMDMLNPYLQGSNAPLPDSGTSNGEAQIDPTLGEGQADPVSMQPAQVAAASTTEHFANEVEYAETSGQAQPAPQIMNGYPAQVSEPPYQAPAATMSSSVGALPATSAPLMGSVYVSYSTDDDTYAQAQRLSGHGRYEPTEGGGRKFNPALDQAQYPAPQMHTGSTDPAFSRFAPLPAQARTDLNGMNHGPATRDQVAYLPSSYIAAQLYGTTHSTNPFEYSTYNSRLPPDARPQATPDMTPGIARPAPYFQGTDGRLHYANESFMNPGFANGFNIAYLPSTIGQPPPQPLPHQGHLASSNRKRARQQPVEEQYESNKRQRLEKSRCVFVNPKGQVCGKSTVSSEYLCRRCHVRHADHCSKCLLKHRRGTAPPPPLTFIPNLGIGAIMEHLYPICEGVDKDLTPEEIERRNAMEDEWVERFIRAAAKPVAEDVSNKAKHHQKVFNGNWEIEHEVNWQCEDGSFTRKLGKNGNWNRYTAMDVNASYRLLYKCVMVVHNGGQSVIPDGAENHGYRPIETQYKTDPKQKFTLPVTLDIRLEKIRSLMEKDKLVVQDVIEGKAIKAIAESPWKYEQRKRANESSNDRKSEQMEAARALKPDPALSEEQDAAEHSDESEDNAEAEPDVEALWDAPYRQPGSEPTPGPSCRGPSTRAQSKKRKR